MPQQYITCPNCGKRFQLSKALTQQIESDLRKAFATETQARDREVQAAYAKRLADATARAQKRAQTDLKKKLAAEQTRLAREARQAARVEFTSELAGLHKQLQQKEKDAAAMKQKGEELAALKTQLEHREKAIDAEIEQKLRKAVGKAEADAVRRNEEEHRIRESELEKKLIDARKQASELRIRLELSSEVARGAAAERRLGADLKKAFPEDKIEPVPKGKLGADVLQRVYSAGGKYCGTIIWESKNVRNWSKAWLPKLRTDQRRAKADLAVLVSNALPKDVSHFAQIDGVWVTEYSLIVGLASALRSNIAQVAVLKQASTGSHGKLQLLYEYLSSLEFKHRIEAMVEAFRTMQEDLERERQTTEKHWAKREKQIQLVVQNIAGMYGDMQGIVGQALPKIRRLELPGPAQS